MKSRVTDVESFRANKSSQFNFFYCYTILLKTQLRCSIQTKFVGQIS